MALRIDLKIITFNTNNFAQKLINGGSPANDNKRAPMNIVSADENPDLESSIKADSLEDSIWTTPLIVKK